MFDILKSEIIPTEPITETLKPESHFYIPNVLFWSLRTPHPLIQPATHLNYTDTWLKWLTGPWGGASCTYMSSRDRTSWRWIMVKFAEPLVFEVPLQTSIKQNNLWIAFSSTECLLRPGNLHIYLSRPATSYLLFHLCFSVAVWNIEQSLSKSFWFKAVPAKIYLSLAISD